MKTAEVGVFTPARGNTSFTLTAVAGFFLLLKQTPVTGISGIWKSDYFQTNTKQFISFLAGQKEVSTHLTRLLLIDEADRSNIHLDLPVQPPGKWNLSKLLFVFHDHLWICLSPTLRRAAPACQFVPFLVGLMSYSQFFCRRRHIWKEQKPLSRRRLKTSLLFYISVLWRWNGDPGCSTSETASGVNDNISFSAWIHVTKLGCLVKVLPKWRILQQLAV